MMSNLSQGDATRTERLSGIPKSSRSGWWDRQSAPVARWVCGGLL